MSFLEVLLKATGYPRIKISAHSLAFMRRNTFDRTDKKKGSLSHRVPFFLSLFFFLSTKMANKRQKLDTNPETKFHTGLLEEESASTIEKAFKESKPYLHCKIDTLVNDDLLRKVRKEILSNLHFTLKETDIYKVKRPIEFV
jgi:Rps23 Pro-64 3,4-dihydroxylase Tpa1-like proline 4-hydroxylase